VISRAFRSDLMRAGIGPPPSQVDQTRPGVTGEVRSSEEGCVSILCGFAGWTVLSAIDTRKQ